VAVTDADSEHAEGMNVDETLVRVIGTIRPTHTEEIAAEAATFAQARELVIAQVPDGWQLLNIRTDATQHHTRTEPEPQDE
jgi:hypothetical protein